MTETNRTGLNLIIMKIVLGVFALALLVPGVQADQQVLKPIITLYAGESRVIQTPGVVRISVGKAELIGSTLLDNGQIVLIAEEAGETNMQVWFADGHRESMAIVIMESNVWREVQEVRRLLQGIPGIEVKTIGRQIVVDGEIQTRDLERVNAIKKHYPDMLILARELTPYERKMIYFDVRVVEINRDVTEELGINWSKSFAGPTIGYEKAWTYNALGMPANSAGKTPFAAGLLAGVDAIDNVLGVKMNGKLTPAQQNTVMHAVGDEYVYWGISTSITSMINLLEQTGSALTLSRPRLSARSGGSASLTVGGEVPVITSSVSGQSVTYKDYGIILDIKPKMDMHQNITATVSVAVSQLDLANAVNGQPAFKKRETSNDIKLKPGETLALSGLITREEQVSYSGIKWLSRIPILGHLFKSKSFTSGETELVILITPHVIDDMSEGLNQELVERADELVEEFKERSSTLME